jgi:hypothetical protein
MPNGSTACPRTRRGAQERDIANITWIQARAEDLPAVAPGPYRLVTFDH